MKLSIILFSAAAALSAVYAEDSPATVAPGGDATTAPATEAPVTEGPATVTEAPTSTTTPSTTTTAPTSGSSGTEAPSPNTGGPTNTDAGTSPYEGVKQKAYGTDYHMPYVRVIQARVQSDKPELVKGRFVSKYGNGDLAKGYMSSMDSVNTASVEGALMFVQAEGINQNSRAEKDRCVRKNNMNYVVLYEILMAQTNETLAQFQDSWNVPEYGPMIPMDTGRCTPLTGTTFPPECLQFNGIDGQPNIGPFVGGGLKNDDIRAPYPDTYWFSFPNTCPLKVWGEKADADDTCRATSRKGLCDVGKAPDGVECTFAYDILGWVAIDDVVGITSLKDDSGKLYGNFTTWCEASKDHIEFAGSDKTGEMEKGLDFWKDPLDQEKNTERAGKVLEIYTEMLSGDFTSTMVTTADLKHFKDLPNPVELAEKNPPCYKSVQSCNSGNGCERLGFSQICMPCKAASATCKTDSGFTFPKLAKAPTTLSDDELTSGDKLGGKNGATGNVNGTNTKPTAAASSSGFTLAAVATSLVVATLAL